jgi:pyruvate,water dikinase
VRTVAPIRVGLGLLAEQTRRSARLREDQRFAWQRGLAQLRRLYLLAGAVLVRAGALPRAEDVFFLTVEELRGPFTRATDLRSRVADRARSFEAQMQRFAREGRASYPPFLRGNEPFEAAVAIGDAERSKSGRSALRGEPVSPGIGRGRARIVLRPDDLDTVCPGEVLVARGADPAWTLIFDRLSALVTESGGQLSHAAVVAREFRLPAVLGVDRATQLIRPGDELVVDGTSGVIRKAS